MSHFSPSEGPSTARPGRQTLLFSATQSKDLASLARLSLHDPLYINCNKVGEEGVVPSNLEQYYLAIPLDKKLDALWGFVKSHLKMKGVVFVTSGKQVRAMMWRPKNDSSRFDRFASSLRPSAASIQVYRSCTCTESKSSPRDSTSFNGSRPPNQPCSSVQM